MKRFKFVCLTAISLLIAISTAQAIELSDAVRKFLDTHPDIASAKYLAGAGEERVKEAYGSYYPSLDLQASAGLDDTYNSTTRSGGHGHVYLDPKGVTLTLSQNVFSGFKTQNTVKKKKADFDYAVLKLHQASEDIGLKAIAAYLNILRDERLVALAEDNLAAHESVLNLVSQKFKQGVGPESDVNQASVRVKSAQAALIDFKRSLANSKAAYQSLIGEDPEALMVPILPSDSIDPDLEGKIEKAMKSNPYIRGAYARLRVAEADLALEDSSFMPNVNLEASFKHRNDVSGTPGVNEEKSIMFLMKYNLFSGGADYHKKQSSILLKKKAEHELSIAERRVTEMVKNSHNALEAATARLEAFTIQEEESFQVRDTYYDQFKVGRRSLLDLLNSEQELFRARSDKTKEEFSEMYAVYKVLQSQGLLLKSAGVALPGNFDYTLD